MTVHDCVFHRSHLGLQMQVGKSTMRHLALVLLLYCGRDLFTPSSAFQMAFLRLSDLVIT